MSEITSRLAAALADRYTIERELGSGGMATVYLAHDLKHDRKVAIKVLRPELAAAVGAGRFLREIRIEARLQHPHILTLIDSGEADGLLYYVMPYVEGVSLRGKLARDGRFPIPEVVRLLREIVGALAHAHEQGIVHRDVKPDNVLLSGEHHAVVTDFGVAKALGEVVGRQDATTVGLALGTPAYMAPEQAMADPNVDHRADLYALGVVAYEMLTGAPPFAGVTPQATLAAHLTETPDPVAVKRPDVPDGLADLVMRCLEKDPAARWQDARALLQRLETIATPGGTVVPDEAGARRRRGETLAGHPVRWWVRRIGMVVAVLAVLGIAGTWYRARRAETAALLAALAPAVEEGRFDDVYERLRVEGRSLRESPLRNLAAAVGGTLTVRTDPAGAAVRVSRVQPIETFPAHEALQLGRTPVVGFPLVAGEYLVALDGPNLKGVQRLVQIGVGAEALVAATLQPPSADDTDMVPVEAGTVIVAGETSEVAAFLIDEHEVTNEEYVAFIAAGGYR
ncbi:MAG: protein kinase, partial [Gemmatimonadales bacterium]|nr:protein kinase [Gemmatimonadales bacterium]